MVGWFRAGLKHVVGLCLLGVCLKEMKIVNFISYIHIKLTLAKNWLTNTGKIEGPKQEKSTDQYRKNRLANTGKINWPIYSKNRRANTGIIDWPYRGGILRGPGHLFLITLSNLDPLIFLFYVVLDTWTPSFVNLDPLTLQVCATPADQYSKNRLANTAKILINRK